MLDAQGDSIVDPGCYQNLTDDFSAQISAYKNGGAEIVTGVPIPPDFTTFWTQAAQQNFKPKVGSIGKALLFPVAVEALDDPASVRDALAATDLNTVVGNVKWGDDGPFKNVAKTPLVGGQWPRGGAFHYEMVLVSNNQGLEQSGA